MPSDYDVHESAYYSGDGEEAYLGMDAYMDEDDYDEDEVSIVALRSRITGAGHTEAAFMETILKVCPPIHAMDSLYSCQTSVRRIGHLGSRCQRHKTSVQRLILFYHLYTYHLVSYLLCVLPMVPFDPCYPCCT